jgi:hypothetical protein
MRKHPSAIALECQIAKNLVPIRKVCEIIRFCCQQLIIGFLRLVLAISDWEIENGFPRRTVRQIVPSLPKNIDRWYARCVLLTIELED